MLLKPALFCLRHAISTHSVCPPLAVSEGTAARGHQRRGGAPCSFLRLSLDSLPRSLPPPSPSRQPAQRCKNKVQPPHRGRLQSFAWSSPEPGKCGACLLPSLRRRTADGRSTDALKPCQPSLDSSSAMRIAVGSSATSSAATASAGKYASKSARSRRMIDGFRLTVVAPCTVL